MHEWPLIVFTLLMQASIGGLLLTLLLCIPRYTSWTEDQRDNVLRLPLLTLFVAGGLGMLASVFHLGNPWHMFYTIMHVSTSWMSREIVSVGAYMGLLTLCVAFVLSEWSVVSQRLALPKQLVFWKKRLFLPLLLITAIVGSATVFVMSECYTGKIFVLWTRPLVYASYWGATLLAGGILACSTLFVSLRKYDEHEETIGRLTRIAFFAGCSGFFLFVAAALSLSAQIGQPVSNAITVRQVVFDQMFFLSVLRAVLLAIGLFILYRMVKRPPRTVKLYSPFLAAMTIFAGEFIGRYVFFSLGLGAVQ